MSIKKVTVKFVDDELGDSLWNITFDENRHDFNKCFKTAVEVMYLPFDEGFDASKENRKLTKEHYDIAAEILNYGDYGVTDDRFCEFLEYAFGFKCESVKEVVRFDVEKGEIL